MTSNFANRFCSRVGFAVLLAFLGSVPSVLAQGQGPDPFQPYTSQYNPYTYPMGPASPEAGQSGTRSGGNGFRGSNRFQELMDEVGGERGRSGIGTPYFRNSVDPAFDTANRSYRPNQKADLSFEESQRLVTQKYLAYLSERDPRRRAELLKEYRRSQRSANRALSVRPDSPSRLLENASRRTAGATDAASTEARSRGSATASGRAASGRLNAEKPPTGIGPPPPISSVRRAPRSAAGTEPSPSDVLERARQRDLGTSALDDAPADPEEKPAPRRRAGAPPASNRQP
jgi:hypothetical protein